MFIVSDLKGVYLPDAFFANAARGNRKKLNFEILSEDELETDIDFIDDCPSNNQCRKSWSQLVYKIYEKDPLKCPNCGSEMKIIEFIQDYHEIKKILKHPGLWPVKYPKIKEGDLASPINFQLNLGLLAEQSILKYMN